MKNYFNLLLLTLLTITIQQQDSYACNNWASIEGPSGRCGVTTSTPTTYTGTHDIWSLRPSTCTIYEWSITGGTIIGPTGISVTNGKLCVFDNPFECLPKLSASCDNSDVDPAITAGNGASITVIWNLAELQHTLSLTVKEGNNSASDQIVNDITLSNPTSIIPLSQSNNSGTYRANLDRPICPGMTVNWTIDGNFAGTGNPRSLPVGLCSTAEICATVVRGAASSPPACRNLNGGTLVASINGSSTAVPQAPEGYSFLSSQPIASIAWSINPPSAGNILGPNDGTDVAVRFTQSGIIDVCAVGTTVCGNSFTKCKPVNVSSLKPSGQQASARTENETVLVNEKMLVIPTLIDRQQDLQVQLPVLEKAVTLRIIDLNGRVVFEQTTNDQNINISTEKMSTGLYVLTGQSGNWTSTEKFVVE